MKKFIEAHQHIFSYKSLLTILFGSSLFLIIINLASGGSWDRITDVSIILFATFLSAYLILGIPTVLYLEKKNIRTFSGYTKAAMLAGLIPSAALGLFLASLMLFDGKLTLENLSFPIGLAAATVPFSLATAFLCSTTYWSFCINGETKKRFIYILIAIFVAYIVYSVYFALIASGD